MFHISKLTKKAISDMTLEITKSISKSTSSLELLTAGIEYAISISNEFTTYLGDKYTHTQDVSGPNNVYIYVYIIFIN